MTIYEISHFEKIFLFLFSISCFLHFLHHPISIIHYFMVLIFRIICRLLFPLIHHHKCYCFTLELLNTQLSSSSYFLPSSLSFQPNCSQVMDNKCSQITHRLDPFHSSPLHLFLGALFNLRTAYPQFTYRHFSRHLPLEVNLQVWEFSVSCLKCLPVQGRVAS